MAVIVGRRELIAAFGGAAVVWPLGARAQQRAKSARVGFLSSSSPRDVFLESFIRGMGVVGYSRAATSSYRLATQGGITANFPRWPTNC